MNVLLTHGYFIGEDPKEQAIMKPYPPLGILYLSAWLDRHGVDNAVFDTTFSTPEKLQRYLLEHRPRIAALYVNLMTKRNVLAIIRFIRTQPALENTLIVLGGPDVTHNAEDYLRHGADLIVIGEGEQTMLEVGLRITDYGLRITDSGLRITDCGLRIADYGLRIDAALGTADEQDSSGQSAIRNPQSVIRNPQSVIRNPESAIRNPQSVIRNPQSVIRNPQSAIRNPQSAIRNPQSAFHHIPGLAYLLPDGSLHRTAPREKLRDLDELPLPNRQKIDLQLYLDAWKKAHGHSAVSVSTQRGCPYTCRWCSTAVYGQSYRRRSPRAVVDEIEWLQAHYEFDLIWFVDDVFTVSHKWLNEFHDELQRRNVRVSFECITRADRLNEDVIRTLKNCGCFRVWIGAESGSQRIIDAMDRRVDVQQVRDMIRAARQAGIQAGTFIMLGYPGETEADIRETAEHLKASNPDLFTITVAYPIKGTGLYEEVQATASSALPWADRSDRDLDFRRTYPRRYYDFAVRWTVNAVYWHKAGLEKRRFSFSGMRFLAKMWLARGGMWWWRKN